MTAKGIIRVLVVDDSMLFRETVARYLDEDPGIDVVGTAADPYMARDLILELEPDVITLDVEMPRMNGIEFLKRLMPQYPMPVVMVSSVDSRVFEALEAGAVDFVRKPEAGRADRIESMARELKIKVKIASTARIEQRRRPAQKRTVASGADLRSDHVDLITIGASTGGTEAVERILKQLPASLPPILVVQHMPPVFTRLYAERLDRNGLLHVQEATDGVVLNSGEAYVAAGERHMTVRKGSTGFYIRSRPGDKVSGHCPSVDALFESVVRVPDIRVIAILLTGMGQDGAKGLLQLRRRGHKTIGQDEASSVVYGMPRVAYEMGAVQYQEPLERIPERIIRILKDG